MPTPASRRGCIHMSFGPTGRSPTCSMPSSRIGQRRRLREQHLDAASKCGGLRSVTAARGRAYLPSRRVVPPVLSYRVRQGCWPASGEVSGRPGIGEQLGLLEDKGPTDGWHCIQRLRCQQC